MPAPYDYTITAPAGPQPSDALASGLQLGAGLQARDMALEAQRIALAQAEQKRKDLYTLSTMQNPTARDYASIVTRYPELKDSFKESFAALNTEQRQQKLDAAAPIFSALQAGRPDLATRLLEDNVSALRNSKAPEREIKAAETWLNLLKEAPQHAQFMGGTFLASVMGPEKFEQVFGKVGSERREEIKLPSGVALTEAQAAEAREKALYTGPRATAEIANINSQIKERGARLALDTDKLETETALKLQELTQKAGEIKPDARKLINEAAAASVMATNSASQMRGLADQFDKVQAWNVGGAPATVNEAFKSFTGSQDYLTQLRREYTRIRALQVNSLLPPGPASDKDIQNAQAGFLKETANPAELASWLRGMAKLQEYTAKYEDARGEWAGVVGHLGKTPKDIEIGGRKVASGTMLTDFVRQTLENPGPVTTVPAPGKGTGYMEKYGKKKDPTLGGK
jgi:hypothetical protein